jgi:NADPH-dependent ferric siderophore reductase
VPRGFERRELTVAGITPLGPGFVSITFTGEDLADFVSLSFDDHVKLMFDESAETPLRRDYTPTGRAAGRARAFVVVMADADDRRDLRSRAAAEVQWVDNADALVAALQAWTPPAGTGVAWGGGEAQAMARVRQVLSDKGVPRELTRVSAYWKQGVADHHETLE